MLEKVALFSRVHSDSTNLRDCTAKGKGFAIMWKPLTTGMKTWVRDDYGAHTFRTTSSTGPPWQSVVREIPQEKLNTGEVLEDLAVNPSEQLSYYATIPGGPKDLQAILH